MQDPPIPANEEARLEALRRYAVLDTPAEEAFDRLTRLASDVLGTPIALVSLIDEDRQWFKSRLGVEASETPRSIAFCAHAICEDEVFVVPDAAEDGRFAANPFVLSDPNVRFYAGAQVRTPEGHALGTLCIVDRVPRDFTDRERRILASLAALVSEQLELRRVGMTDGLTGALNRRGFLERGERELRRSGRLGRPVAAAMLDIDHFKRINDGHGHDAGDAVLRAVSAACRDLLRYSDLWGRLGGEEFGILLRDADLATALPILERLRQRVAELDLAVPGGSLRITASIGLALCGEETLEAALERADRALYRAKQGGRNRIEVAD